MDCSTSSNKSSEKIINFQRGVINSLKEEISAINRRVIKDQISLNAQLIQQQETINLLSKQITSLKGKGLKSETTLSQAQPNRQAHSEKAKPETHRSFEMLKARLFFWPTIITKDLPSLVKTIIAQKAQQAYYQKFELLQDFLAKAQTSTSMVIHHHFFKSPTKPCATNCDQPKLGTLCCLCQLTYSYFTATIILENFENEWIQTVQGPILITPQLLLDFGMVEQFIFSQPHQTESFGFGSQLSCAISKTFSYNNKFVKVKVNTAFGDWNMLHFEPAIHRIWINGYKLRPFIHVPQANFAITLSRPTELQIRHQRLRTLALKHHKIDFWCEGFCYRLFAENSIQKIYVEDKKFLSEFDFTIRTLYPELFHHYNKEFENQINDMIRRNIPDSPPEDEGCSDDFEDLIGEEGMFNLANIMDD